MDNSILMAVVDAAEDLFHEDSCVTFSKLSSLQNFVKQFATLANSTVNIKKIDNLVRIMSTFRFIGDYTPLFGVSKV